MNELTSMLESLTEYQRKNYKIVLMRENNFSFRWEAYVCKTDIPVDRSCRYASITEVPVNRLGSCNVNDMSLADVLNTILSYGMKVEINHGYFMEFSENEILELFG